jgi:hypothetical protein
MALKIVFSHYNSSGGRNKAKFFYENKQKERGFKVLGLI